MYWLVCVSFILNSEYVQAGWDQGTAQPNVLVLLADDLGWSDLGCYGSEFHESPNLDQLAREGVRFTTAYSAASLCSPTRASIMTGKHPVRVNITDWIPGAGDKGRKLETPADIHNLPLSETTLGEAFQEAGYSTFYVGKWHLGNPDHGPDKQGFDTYVPTAKRRVAPNGKSQRSSIPIPKGDRWHLTRYITQQAKSFLDRQDRQRPFFAFVSYHDVHTPILADNQFFDGFQNKAARLGEALKPVLEGDGQTRMSQNNPKYASMVRGLDQSVGEILDSLEKSGLSNRTIVLFASDNGGLSTLKRPGPTSNQPLRAGKGWLYEGGIRIPLIVRLPERVSGGTQAAQPVVTTDFYPTLLELAGLNSKPNQHVDGVSFAGLLLGRAKPGVQARELYWHFPHYHGSRWTPGSAVRSGKWKLIRFYESQSNELYDLESDVSEKRDLASKFPEKLEEMSRKLSKWQQQLGARLPAQRKAR